MAQTRRNCGSYRLGATGSAVARICTTRRAIRRLRPLCSSLRLGSLPAFRFIAASQRGARSEACLTTCNGRIYSTSSTRDIPRGQRWRRVLYRFTWTIGERCIVGACVTSGSNPRGGWDVADDPGILCRWSMRSRLRVRLERLRRVN